MCRSRRDMIQAGARLCQLLGLPRSTGQIFGLLYLATKPLSLDDIVVLLGISKGSASTGTRQLAAWGAVREVWIPGDRKDHYEVVTDLQALIRASVSDYLRPRIVNSGKRLDSMLRYLQEDEKHGYLTAEEYKICVTRVKDLCKLQKRLKGFMPFAEKFL